MLATAQGTHDKILVVICITVLIHKMFKGFIILFIRNIEDVGHWWRYTLFKWSCSLFLSVE